MLSDRIMRNVLAGLVLTLLTLIGAPILLACMLFGLRDTHLITVRELLGHGSVKNILAF